MISILYVGLGGFIGSVLRYLIMMGAASLTWRGHWATLAVNALGSLAIGFLSPYFADPKHPAKLFLIVGVLGGFTTFSSFSMDTLALYHNREFMWMGLNIFLNIILCLLCVWCGFKLHRALF